MSSTGSDDRQLFEGLSAPEWRDLICEAIHEAHAEDCVDIGGGVSTAEIAARIPGWEDYTVRSRVAWLADEGVLERRSGMAYDMSRPRSGYVITEGGEEMEVSR